MLKKIKNIFYLISYIIFITFIIVFYFSDENIRSINKSRSLNYENLNKKITETGNSQVHELMRMVTGTFQHWGQVNYIRGIIENRIWYTGNTKEKR